MKATIGKQSAAQSFGPPTAAQVGTARRWARLLAGILLILAFAFGALPRLQRLGPVREVRDAIQSAGIDASALLYSESEVYSEAEASIRDALQYPARRAE